MVAVAVIGGAVVGLGASALQADAMGDAADTQAGAARYSADTQRAMFNTTQENLKPYMAAGKTGLNALMEFSGLNEGGDPITSPLLRPVTMDQASLEKTPGYQFALTQGMKGVQNSAAAKGLGVSGTALKGAATFATGLADTTYQNQFANQIANQSNAFNRLMALTNIGQNSAVNVGNMSAQVAGNIGASTMAGANAQAAGMVGQANAWAGGLNNAAGGVQNAYMLNALTNGGLFK